VSSTTNAQVIVTIVTVWVINFGLRSRWYATVRRYVNHALRFPNSQNILLPLVFGVLIVLPAPRPRKFPRVVLRKTIRIMAEKIDRLEKRLADVEAKQARDTSVNGDKTDALNTSVVQTPVVTEEVPVSESHEHTMEIPGGPALHIRGFSDVNYHASNQSRETNSFALGAFDCSYRRKFPKSSAC